MASAIELIKSAYETVGTYSQGETLDSYRADVGLKALQRMLDNWSNNHFTIYTVTTENYALTLSKASYTYGSGGDFNASRPEEILSAYRRDVNGDDSDLNIIDRERYNRISDKDLAGTPTELYYKQDYATGTVYLNRAPNQAYTLYLDVLKPLTTPTSISSTMTFPPGYDLAIEQNLAVLLYPKQGLPVNPDVRSMANKSLNDLKRTNIRVPMLNASESQTAGYNIYTDE